MEKIEAFKIFQAELNVAILGVIHAFAFCSESLSFCDSLPVEIYSSTLPTVPTNAMSHPYLGLHQTSQASLDPAVIFPAVLLIQIPKSEHLFRLMYEI